MLNPRSAAACARSRILLLLSLALLSFAALSSTAHAFTHGTISTSMPDAASTGDWSNSGTWMGFMGSPVMSGPNSSSDVEIADTDTVNLDIAATAGKLTIKDGGTLDLNGQALFVYGDLILEDGSTIANSGITKSVFVYGKLTVGAASITKADVTLLDCDTDAPSIDPNCTAPTPTLQLDPGTSTWTSSTLTQTGGTAVLAGHDNSSLNLTLDGVSVSVTDPTRLGALTLQGTSPVAITAKAKVAAPSDPAILRLASLAASGTHTVSTTWSYTSGSPGIGDRVNLVSTTSGDPSGLTATDAGVSDFSTSSGLLFVTYASTLASSGAPTLVSSNVNTAAARTGDTLTCGPGSWTDTPDSRSWWWKRGSTAISGHTTSTYTVQDGDIGQNITCSVTATKSGVSVSSVYSSAVSVPTAPSVDLTMPFKDGQFMTDAIRSTGLWSVAWGISGGTLTGCKLNGAAVSCSGTKYAFDPAQLPDASTSTFEMTAENTAGTTVTKSVSFAVALPKTVKLDVAQQNGAVIAPGDLVELAIEAESGASVTCKLNGVPLACTTTAVAFPASLPTVERLSDTVEVTAALGGRESTVIRTVTVTGNRSMYDFPTPILAAAGTQVKIRTDLDFQFWAHNSPRVAYRFTGPFAVAWTPIDSGGWYSRGTEVSFTAPSRAGTYRSELRWGPDGFAKVDELLVKTFTADQVNDTLTFDGITNEKAPIKCPGKGPYSWYVNDVLRIQTDSPYLPATTKVANAVVGCVSTDPRTGKPLETKALIVGDGTKLTAAASGKTVKLVISRPSSLYFSLYHVTSARLGKKAGAAAKKKPKTLATFKVKVKKGKATIKLPKKARKKIGKKKFQIQIRVVGKKGKRSAPLTLNGN